MPARNAKKILMLMPIMLAALMFTLAPTIRPVLAQGGWSHTFDFQQSQGGFTIVNRDDWTSGGCPGQADSGAYTPGVGFYSTDTGEPNHCGAGGYLNEVIISYELSEPVHLTHVSITYDWTDPPAFIESKIVGGNSIEVGGILGGSPPPAPTVRGSNVTFAQDINFTPSIIVLTGMMWRDSTPVGGYIRFMSLTLSGDTGDDPFPPEENNYYRPMSSPDVALVEDNNRTVWANKENPNVHSITGGTIYSTTHITFGGSSWTVKIAPPGATTEADVITYNGLQSVNGKVGDSISAGCVLGLAVSKPIHDGSQFSVGKITLAGPDNIIDNWPDFPDSPTDEPCDAGNLQTTNCINLNPNFADKAREWNIEGEGYVSPGGVTLNPDASIYQDVNLDSADPYKVTIGATIVGAEAGTDFHVTVGQADSTVHLNISIPGEFVTIQTQVLSIGQADYAPNKYRLRITNQPAIGNFETKALIHFVCIGTETPQVAPGACYFSKEASNMQVDDWEKDENVTYNKPFLSILAGSYTIPATEAIWHNIDISAWENQDTGFSLHVRSTPGAGTPLIGPYGRWHAFIRDPVNQDVLVDIGTWDTMAVIVTAKRSDFTLTQGEHIVGDLVIQNITDEITSPGWSMNIEQACLMVDGGVWPGYANTDTGSLFNANCIVPSTPNAPPDLEVESLLGWVVAWLQFGWSWLGFILQCIIYGAINTIYAAILAFMAGLALFGVWVGLVISALAAWAGDGLRFFFGNLIAGLIPIANLIIAWLFSLPFIQSLVDAVGLALIWLQALFDVVVGILNLFLLAVQLIGAMLNLIGVGWNAFLAALNGTSSVTFPFPDCTNPSTPFYDACIPLDVANFFFGQVPMAAAVINAIAFSVAWRSMKKTLARAQEALNS